MTRPTSSYESLGCIDLIKKRVVGFIKNHPIFFFSVLFWVVFWIFFVEPLALLMFWTVPIIVLVLFLSLFCISTELKAIAVFVWSAPLALGLLVVLAQLLTFMVKGTHTYYLGMDVSTPTGVKECRSMVEVVDDRLPWRWIARFAPGDFSVKGEAFFCKFDDGQNLIGVLAFEDDLGGGTTLSRLPWLAKDHPTTQAANFLPFYSGQIELKDNLIPILVTMPNVEDPMSLMRVYPDNAESTLGQGYFIERIWLEMTKNSYQSSGIKEHVPWLGSRAADGTWAYVNPFKKLGLQGVSRPMMKTM